MAIRSEEYQEEQFKSLCEMVFGLYTEDPAGEPLTIEKIRLTVEEAKCHPDKLKIFILYNKEELIGYSILNFIWSNEYGGDIVNIDEIYIRPEARGKGYGSQWIGSIPDLFPNAKTLKLEASPSNSKAIDLYRRIGFSEASNLHMTFRV